MIHVFPAILNFPHTIHLVSLFSPSLSIFFLHVIFDPNSFILTGDFSHFSFMLLPPPHPKFFYNFTHLFLHVIFHTWFFHMSHTSYSLFSILYFNLICLIHVWYFHSYVFELIYFHIVNSGQKIKFIYLFVRTQTKIKKYDIFYMLLLLNLDCGTVA